MLFSVVCSPHHSRVQLLVGSQGSLPFLLIASIPLLPNSTHSSWWVNWIT